VPIAVTGNVESDVESVRAAANGGAHLAFDQVGGAKDPNMTLTALRSLRRGGRLVLMRSMSVPLPISYLDKMFNNWEVLGPIHVSQAILLATLGPCTKWQARPYQD
jgi:alcohol dehydrogenase